VAATLAERITAGVYPSGSQLPTEATLVDEFDVARDTIRRALAALAESGIVVTVHGRGSFVADDSREDVGLPRHAQVAAELRSLIESGQAQPGTEFLTEAEIQAKYTISRTTARAACGAGGALLCDGSGMNRLALPVANLAFHLLLCPGNLRHDESRPQQPGSDETNQETACGKHADHGAYLR
jgi:DNA-binding transcriptional regulator YhcF (GntR family)